MKPSSTTNPSQSSWPPTEALTIRLASPADAAALRRLAELDSAAAFRPMPMLVAEVDDELYAALPLDGGPAIANPFRRTVELVAMLAERARQLQVSVSGRADGRSRRRALRAAIAPRA
jgi:hypothetical protein